mmetsp:Transcript_123325/g.293092  ORF Transcript_123325/g.293092 Transcript_123325/m.293092 type:complete len:128 (-) Transcript_123325:502-885(-)
MCPAVGIGRLGLAQKTERGELAKLLFCSCSDSRRSETPARRHQLWRMPCQGGAGTDTRGPGLSWNWCGRISEAFVKRSIPPPILGPPDTMIFGGGANGATWPSSCDLWDSISFNKLLKPELLMGCCP